MKQHRARLLTPFERAQRRRAATDYLRYDGPERRQAPRRRSARLRWRLRQLIRGTASS